MEDVFLNFCGSPLWDANLTWYTDDPDLTPCFEKTVLLWVPAVFLLLSLPFECCRTNRSKALLIPWSWLNISRMSVVWLQMVVSVAKFTYVIRQGHNYPADIVAPLVQSIVFGIMLSLLVFHKRNGLRISYVMFLLSLLLVLSLSPQMYSYSKAYHHSNAPDIKMICMDVGVYLLSWSFFILQFFYDKKPFVSEHPTLECPSPKTMASVPSRLFFQWLTPMVLLGKKKPLTADDVYSLDHDNSSGVIVPTFNKHWRDSVQKERRKNVTFDQSSSTVTFHRASNPQASILPALCKTFGPYFLTGSMIRMVYELLSFVNPHLLKRVIRFVSSDEALWKGCLYAALMVVCSLTQLVLNNRYCQIMNIGATRIHTALVSVIYQKSLRLSNAARKKSTLGEIVNLMAVDAASFKSVLYGLNTTWATPLQVSLAIYFLWEILGPAVIAGLAVIVFSIPINMWLVRKNRQLRIRLMKHKDERIKVMNEILTGIKVLKLYAWELSFEEKVSRIREKEINLLKTISFLNTTSNIIFSMTPYMVALASFSMFVFYDEHNILSAEVVFVSLSIFNILRFPLEMLPQNLNDIMLASVIIKRMNKFLNNDELDPNAVQRDTAQREQIVISNGTFSWDASDQNSTVLHNITLQVAPGALVAVVGSVGAGKSSLLSAILGEMDKLAGTVNTKGSIAYVPQQAWIQNTTLRKNITCTQEFDESSFKRVLKACALEQDIDMLPGGDMTEIGEKGINLSGGQKQRVNLARAVYSQADVYLLDDPLSAVDAHVGKHIFENLIGPQGILNKKTRVLVTHGVTFLPQTDLIVVMKNGRVSEIGTYNELLQNKGDFADFLLQEEEVEPELEEVNLNNTASIRHGDLSCPENLEGQFLSEVDGSQQRHSNTSKNKSTLDKPQMEDKNKLMTTEEMETGNVQLSVFLFYIKSMGSVMALVAIVGYVLYQGLVVAANLWLSRWSSDNSTSLNGTQDLSRTNLYLSVYGALGVIQAVTNVVANLSMSLGCLMASSKLHAGLLQQILRAPMSYFDTTPLGRIVNRFSRDINVLDSNLSSNISSFLTSIIRVFFTMCVISYSTPPFMFVIIPIIVFNIFMQRNFVPTSRQLKRLESTSRSPIHSHFSESLQGASSIRAYGIQEVFITESQKMVDKHMIFKYLYLTAFRWLSVHLELVGAIVVFTATMLVVLSRGSIDPGLAGLSITYALQVTGSMTFLVRNSSEVESSMVAVERVREYSQIQQEAAWFVEPKPDPSWPSRGQIEFKDLAIRYRDGLDLILNGISFTVHPEEKVGIVGRTGAGKSSLTLSLFRILEPASGSICIDEVNIATLGLQDLRSRLTVIPQDPVLFSGTLRTNLDPFNKEQDSALWRVLELTNLKPFVRDLKGQLDYPITEGGDNLSVGQKQLICLSRALLRKTKVLILDEATASVDLETDVVIQKTIRSEFYDCTVLTIAHRLNTVMDYNRILVLDKGKVKEFDSPKSLIQDSSTILHSMAKDAGIISQYMTSNGL